MEALRLLTGFTKESLQNLQIAMEAPRLLAAWEAAGVGLRLRNTQGSGQRGLAMKGLEVNLIGFGSLLAGYHGGTKGLTFFIIQGLHRDSTTPKRLKATYSTSRLQVFRIWGSSRSGSSNLCGFGWLRCFGVCGLSAFSGFDLRKQ